MSAEDPTDDSDESTDAPSETDPLPLTESITFYVDGEAHTISNVTNVDDASNGYVDFETVDGGGRLPMGIPFVTHPTGADSGHEDDRDERESEDEAEGDGPPPWAGGPGRTGGR
jgi:hypothetical protein